MILTELSKKKAAFMALLVSLGIGMGVIFVIGILFNSQQRRTQSTQHHLTLEQMQTELIRLKEENEKAIQEKERLQADTVSYLALNTRLQNERDSLEKAKEELQKEAETAQTEIDHTQKKLQEVEEAWMKEKSSLEANLGQEKEELQKKTEEFSQTLRKERTVFHYNLGVAYSRADLYDEAADAYQQALQYDPDNAEAHYNLGMLLKDVSRDSDKAMVHFQKYLELNPQAEDRKEVERWLSQLQ